MTEAQTNPTSAAVRAGLGVGVSVGLSGTAFGAAAVTAGLSVPQACVLSALAFSGASQFTLIGVAAGGGNLLAGVGGALLLGARNTLYGLRLADLLRPRGAARLLAAQGVIDETTAVTTAQPDRPTARAGFVATFASIFAVWNLTTLVGALGAARLGDPEALGLDALVPAAFLALLWPRLASGRRERRVAVAGAAIAVAATPFLPPGVPVMLAAVATLAGMTRRGRRTDERGDT